jgi:hypothetical protein
LFLVDYSSFSPTVIRCLRIHLALSVFNCCSMGRASGLGECQRRGAKGKCRGPALQGSQTGYTTLAHCECTPLCCLLWFCSLDWGRELLSSGSLPGWGAGDGTRGS